MNRLVLTVLVLLAVVCLSNLKATSPPRVLFYDEPIALKKGRNGGNADTSSSFLECMDANCKVTNACIDRSNDRYVIRLLGNQTHVENLLAYAKAANYQGYRESATFFLAGLDASQTTKVSPTISSPRILPDTTAAIVNRFVSRNCGHTLGDDAWPIFRLMRLFDEPRNRLKDLYYGRGPGHTYCDPVLYPLAETVSVPKDHAPNQTRCYERVYFGTRGVSFLADHGTWPNRLPTLANDTRAFRNLYYQQANISVPLPKVTTPTPDTIVVMEKKAGSHMHNIGNRRQVVGFLQREFPSYTTQLVSWPDYKLMEQVRLMSRTRAMISLPGSDVMNAVFLSDQGALVLYCRKLDRGFDSNEYEHWLRYLPYLSTDLEPCNATGVTYNETETGVDTFVDLYLLKQRLLRQGLQPGGANDDAGVSSAV